MLSKSNRLSKLQFDEVFKKGRVQHSPIFVMRVLIGTKDSRFSAVFPNKIAKTAAERNSSRRKVYNILKDKIFSNNKANVWVSLIAKKSVKNIESSIILEDIKNLFVKSGLLE